jgi:hypothetical protein
MPAYGLMTFGSGTPAFMLLVGSCQIATGAGLIRFRMLPTSVRSSASREGVRSADSSGRGLLQPNGSGLL